MPQDRKRFSKQHAARLIDITKRQEEVSEELAHVKWEIRLVEDEIKALKSELPTLQKKCADLKAEYNTYKSNIEDLKRSEVTVADHAIVRYLERFKGLDVEKLVDEMVPDEALRKIANCKHDENLKYVVVNDVALFVDKGIVKTVKDIDKNDLTPEELAASLKNKP